MPNISITRQFWRGFPSIVNLVIFGDSYSAVNYQPARSPHPTEDQPLGVDFPGLTYTERDTPNWVGHLITNHIDHGPVLVYDYAVGGDNITGVRQQISRGFLPSAAKKPEWARWSSPDTLFITWVGINDCAEASIDTLEDVVKELFKEQERLYEAGARNFLLIDVPPIHRSPVGRAIAAADAGGLGGLVYETWNNHLRQSTEQFSVTRPDCTVLLFSSWDTFTRVLDHPTSHGYSSDDVAKSGGRIWVDHLHPTSRMHDWIAKDLATFLAAQPPYRVGAE